MTRALPLAWAFFVRDFIVDTTYKVTAAIEVLDVAIGVAGFFYLSQVMGDKRPAGYDAFGFILVGVAVNSAMTTALACFAQSVKADQAAGTLKPLLMSPLSAGTMVALSSVYPVLRSAGSAVTYLVAGALLFGPVWESINVPSTLAALLLALGAFAAIGLASAAFTLVVKRGDPLTWLFGALSWLLGGVFFPPDLLPHSLQQMSRLLPITYALRALRATVLTGASVRAVSSDLTVLAVLAILGLPISAMLVSAATSWAKRAGTLGHS